MRGKAKITAASLLALSYLLALGLVGSRVDFCGCGGNLNWLQSSLQSVSSAAGGWNSWLGNSWALGASSWTAPVLASASEGNPSAQPDSEAPVFQEWRLQEGFSIEPLARLAPQLEHRVEFSQIPSFEAPSVEDFADLDCLRSLKEVKLVLARHTLPGPEARVAFEISPQVVVVTAQLPKVEQTEQPLATLSPTPGCPGVVKISKRRSAT
ncbi:MAG TPA: hypothetical protein VLV83_24505 [Acidobacteriota bacterium]|nr:hypothetical protein [Acidobacteriota bacterium]